MIGDQSCLNMIAIESRMHGDHEELNILLQKCMGNWDGCDHAKSVGHDPTTQIPLLLDYHRPIFIGVSTLSHVFSHALLSPQLYRDRRISLMR